MNIYEKLRQVNVGDEMILFDTRVKCISKHHQLKTDKTSEILSLKFTYEQYYSRTESIGNQGQVFQFADKKKFSDGIFLIDFEL